MDTQAILKQYWGFDSFRPLQSEIIESVLADQHTLALLPTGGGKSICFQVPVLALEGICIVVSPLIALIKNQVDNLTQKGIKAIAIHSNLHPRQIDLLLDNCIYGDVKFLYVSPERLKSEIFLERAKKMKINILAIDEAHCISQWGYDFRPAYLEIAQFIPYIKQAKIIALTASATTLVKNDIIEKLGLKNPRIFKQTFARSNLSYSVFEEEDKDKKLLTILTNVKGSAIIYVNSRKKTKSVAEWLQSYGFEAHYYHAGLEPHLRNQKQDGWINSNKSIMVATNAFGMGIDKPNVRSVIHLDLPSSLEAYYQEAGRAGRDGHKAYAVLLHSKADSQYLLEQIETAYPPINELKNLYQMLANYFQMAIGSGFNQSYLFNDYDFQNRFNLKAKAMFHGLKILELEGLIQLNQAANTVSSIIFNISSTDLYDFRIKNSNIDNFLKIILRICGGEVFDNFVEISENKIAFETKVNEKEVEKILDQLHKINILIYNKRSNLPTITYLTPRLDADLLPINVKNIELRKKRDVSKAKAVINFTEINNRCRTLIILDYFDENSEKQCGVCDFCLNQKSKTEDTKTEVLKIELLKILIKPLSIENIKEQFQNYKEEVIVEAIKELLEQELIAYIKPGILMEKIK